MESVKKKHMPKIAFVRSFVLIVNTRTREAYQEHLGTIMYHKDKLLTRESAWVHFTSPQSPVLCFIVKIKSEVWPGIQFRNKSNLQSLMKTVINRT